MLAPPILIAIALILPALAGCDPARSPTNSTDAKPKRPNVLWFVWDTVRADYVGPSGPRASTTPNLDEFAKTARVFDDAWSAASTTVPSHASMFTGLLPSEHGANNAREYLDDQFDTIAELLQRAGYRTYAFSANAYVSQDQNFVQGFDVVEHPWSPQYKAAATEIVRQKLVGDQSSELGGKIAAGNVIKQNIKAAGRLATQGVQNWLKSAPDKKPYFAFINWMEAHRQLIPPRTLRARFMNAEQVEKSYLVDRGWLPMWEFTLGKREYSESDLELTRLTYAAAIAELDELFGELIANLRSMGQLENTIVIVTADHGELLGEQHMLDHQFSVHEPLLRVPLVMQYPPRVPVGHETHPVSTVDLFPTILELVGLPLPASQKSTAISLLSPVADRKRVAEYPSPAIEPLRLVKLAHSDFDHRPWRRGLQAYRDADYKLIVASDGRNALYDLKSDPRESDNLILSRAEKAAELSAAFDAFRKALLPYRPGPAPPKRSGETQQQLNFGGYGNGLSAPEDESSPAATQPAVP